MTEQTRRTWRALWRAGVLFAFILLAGIDIKLMTLWLDQTPTSLIVALLIGPPAVLFCVSVADPRGRTKWTWRVIGRSFALFAFLFLALTDVALLTGWNVSTRTTTLILTLPPAILGVLTYQRRPAIRQP